jgi:hypothetical protein
MLTAAAQVPEVTRARLVDCRHAAAFTYLDMTPMRIIASPPSSPRGPSAETRGLQELMVQANVGSNLFWMVVFFARQKGGR